MSAAGQKQTRRMSALPPKAAAAVADRRVRFGPKGDITVLHDHFLQRNQVH
jgi:hypothetical protein